MVLEQYWDLCNWIRPTLVPSLYHQSPLWNYNLRALTTLLLLCSGWWECYMISVCCSRPHLPSPWQENPNSSLTDSLTLTDTRRLLCRLRWFVGAHMISGLCGDHMEHYKEEAGMRLVSFWGGYHTCLTFYTWQVTWRSVFSLAALG